MDKPLITDKPRFASILGMGFGDCGKGLFTDFLCRRWNAHTVVRFNGGAQAGHNVVLPDGSHHTFSQFGSGSFLPHIFTVLASKVVVHPTALIVEHDHLKRAGVTALDRLLIDGHCRITTPFHQAAGRLREIRRGSSSHGTCGTGVGETVNHSLMHPDEVLYYGELLNPERTREKLDIIRRRLRAEFEDSFVTDNPLVISELMILRSETIADAWVTRVSELLHLVPPSGTDEVATRLHRPGCVIFEGAQGVLLDEWRGFHPHTSWSSTHADAVDLVAEEFALPEPVRHLGVLRTYLTRHGNGPLPTYDRKLDILAEPHNQSNGWQGSFRRGHPDEVLLRYALANVGSLSGLLVSHLDIFDKGQKLEWCSRYESEQFNLAGNLHSGGEKDLSHQCRLTELLKQAKPVYDRQPVDSAAAFLKRLSVLTDIPVLFGSYGNTHDSITSFMEQ